MKTIRNMDWVLMTGVLGLAATGLLMAYLTEAQSHPELWQKYGLFWVAGLIGFVALCFVPLKVIARMGWPLYAVALVLLILVWRIGWKVDLGFFELQSAAMMNGALVLLFAHYFSSREAKGWAGLSLPLLIVVMPAVATLNMFGLETMVTLLLLAMMMIMIAGQWQLLSVAVAAMASVSLLYWLNIHDYQKERIHAWLDRQLAPIDDYALLQPTGEYWTILLSALVLLAALVIWRMISISYATHERFAFILCVAISSLSILYLTLNIGLATGGFSVLNILLPFIMYDGFSLVVLFAMAGLIMRVAIESHASSLDDVNKDGVVVSA